MKRIPTFTLIFLIGFNLALVAQEAPVENQVPSENLEQSVPPAVPTAESPTVRLPVNLYDTYSFDEGKWPYIRTGIYMFGPGFVTVWGLIEWGWFDDGTSFTYKPSKVWGAHALNGASDKFGHLYGTYAVKRLSTFFFRSTGSSPLRSNIEGGIYASSVQLIMEIGDGFSSAQGFDINDVIFNTIGAGIGMLLDGFPVLDRMFALQWEYVPTKKFRKSFEKNGGGDFFTDYSGQKYLLVTKLGGIPYLSLTPLRYVNIDFGYYARGFYNSYFDRDTRNIYIGLSLNYTIAFGDILPTGYTSSTLQSLFNHYHPPFDIEVKDWELTSAKNM